MSNFIVLNFYFQIAQNPANDKKRNFALVDVGNAADAEKLWSELDGAVVKEKCVRMASEVVHPTYESCNEYYQLVATDLVDTGAELNFSCVQAGLIEDLLQSKDDRVNTVVKN